MKCSLRGRHFVKLLDYSPTEIRHLLNLSRLLKEAKYAGVEKKQLSGKNIALLFEKDSTRTRCAFEVAAYDQGAHVTYLGPGGSQINKKETIKDTARVLGRYYDGIEYRGFAQDIVEDLAKNAGVPVWNGLTNEFHPTQVLADFLTIEEHCGSLKGKKIVYVGDGRNNMANSLLVGCAKMGMHLVILSPRSLWPAGDLVEKARQIAKANSACIEMTETIDDAIPGADAIYTDVWVSMGEPQEVWKERIAMLKPFQVNQAMVNKAKDSVVILHCLPSFHNDKTLIGKDVKEKFGIAEMELTDEVFEGKHSVVFDQAENRMHTIKAVMVATLA